MITRAEFITQAGKICRDAYTDPNGGCLLIECKDCGDQIYWYEGDLAHLYDVKISKGCYACKSDNFLLTIGYCEL